jgi:curved DNA-binding protein CbpA
MREGLACRCGRGTLYDVLQVSPWCEPEVIQAAYRALARARHPDLNRDADAEERMRRLNVAYQTLSDPSRRARYDEELALEAARPAATAAHTANGYGANGHASNGHAANGAGTHGYGSRSTATGPRPSGSRPAASGSGPGPGAASTVMTSAAAAPTPAYQTAVFDTRAEMLFPRSAIYASLVIVTVIVALVAWLILDTMAQRPNVPSRLPRGYEELRSVTVAASETWEPERLGLPSNRDFRSRTSVETSRMTASRAVVPGQAS